MDEAARRIQNAANTMYDAAGKMGAEVSSLEFQMRNMNENVHIFSSAVDKLGKIASAIISMEGMKAENEQRKVMGQSVAYQEAAFFELRKEFE